MKTLTQKILTAAALGGVTAAALLAVSVRTPGGAAAPTQAAPTPPAEVQAVETAAEESETILYYENTPVGSGNWVRHEEHPATVYLEEVPLGSGNWVRFEE